jgi:hypothetical protein
VNAPEHYESASLTIAFWPNEAIPEGVPDVDENSGEPGVRLRKPNHPGPRNEKVRRLLVHRRPPANTRTGLRGAPRGRQSLEERCRHIAFVMASRVTPPTATLGELVVLQRYERRALSRRKFAIHVKDDLRLRPIYHQLESRIATLVDEPERSKHPTLRAHRRRDEPRVE